MDDPTGGAIAFRHFRIDNDPVAGGVRALRESLGENGFKYTEGERELLVVDGNALGLGIFGRLQHLEQSISTQASDLENERLARIMLSNQVDVLKRDSESYGTIYCSASLGKAWKCHRQGHDRDRGRQRSRPHG